MVNLPVAYCLLNFLALCFYTDYMYIEPIAGIYEAFTIASLFFLVLEYVCPDGTDREKYFDQLPAQDKKGNIEPGGSLNWFQVCIPNRHGTKIEYTLILVSRKLGAVFFNIHLQSSFSL